MRTFLLLIRQGDETVEGLMTPWGKEVPIEGYWGDPVTEEEKQDVIDEYKSYVREEYENNAWDDYPDWIKNGTEPSFEEAYKDYVKTYEENLPCGKTKTACCAIGLNGSIIQTGIGIRT